MTIWVMNGLSFYLTFRQFEQRIANNLSCIMHKEPWIGNIDVEQQVIVSGFKYACVLTM